MTQAHRLATAFLFAWLSIVPLLLGTRQAQGQAVPTATGPGSRLSLGVLASGFEADYGKRLIGGGAVYVDANLTPFLGLEAEGRTLRLNEEAGVSQSTFLAGPRLILRPHALAPYAKVLAGLGAFRFPYGYANGRYFVLAPGAGVDWRLANTGVKLRLIDFEYQSWPQFTYGQLHPYGVSAGISISLWKSETYRPD